MLDNNFSDLQKEIINRLILIPGIVGFSNYRTINSKPTLLKKENNWKAIKIVQFQNNLIVDLHIIILISVKARLLCNQINEAIESIVLKHKYNFAKSNIYIRGIK